MTRRILAAMLTLTALLIIGVIFPLGLMVDRNYDRQYIDTTLDAPRNIASAAEEKLIHQGSSDSLDRAIARIRGDGESVLIVDAAGHRVTSAGPEVTGMGSLIAPALSGRAVHREAQGRLIAAVPVYGDTRAAGAVVFARPLAPVNQITRNEWALLASVGLIAVLIAAALSLGLARWAGRPLRDLEQAAEALGTGDLDAKARTDNGPPEVRRLAGRFNVMAARLKTLIHDHRIMVADVAHQLRTPLAALRLRLELLTGEAPPDTVEDLHNSLDEINRLSHLVDGLLAVARAEHTTAPPVQIAVGEILAERAEAWAPVAAERHIHLTVTGPEELRALAGAGHLEQVLDNLIDNALTAAPEGGRVGLAATGADPVYIKVCDNGSGMSAKDRDTVFRRFHSGRTDGTGLGLAIVHRLVTSDNGTVTLTETPGGGLTVTIALPASRQEGALRKQRA